MSTSWHYVCKSHRPELDSESVSGSGAGDQLAAYLIQRQQIIDAVEACRKVKSWDYDFSAFTYGSSDSFVVPFLLNHPACAIDIVNEYGESWTPKEQI